MPSRLTAVRANAFLLCQSLSKVEITSLYSWCHISFSNAEANPLSIANNLVLNGNSVTDLVIPSGTQVINYYSFINFSNMNSITIPDTVTAIENSAFEGCSGLKEIKLSSNISRIGLTAFTGCKLKVYIDDEFVPNKKNYGASEIEWIVYKGKCGDNLKWEYDVENSSLSINGTGEMNDLSWDTIPWKSSSIKEVVLSEGISYIGERAFANCINVSEISIPSTVNRIGMYAFYYCTNLSKINIPTTLDYINAYVFAGCYNLTEVVIPDGVRSIEAAAFESCSSLKKNNHSINCIFN